MTDEHASPRPWWQVRPAELAARYGFDADELMGAIDPEDLPDWQLALAFDALEPCQEAGDRAMSLSGSDPGRRTIRTSDPGDKSRLEYAWVALEHVLDNGATAAQLDVEELDHLICDLVAIRHRKLVRAEPNDNLRTVVTERRDESIVLESYIEDEFGNECGPLEER